MNGIRFMLIYFVMIVCVLFCNCGPCVEMADKIMEKPETVEIFEKDIIIPSMSYKCVSYVIPKGASIKGKMEVKEGDNIHLYLFDGSGYNAWQQGGNAKAYFVYESTYLQTFNFTSHLTTTYHLVMQNPAILNRKVVNVKVSMTATKSQLREAGIID